ncbi:MAG: riboflavin synthase [Phycisphaerales bacterium]|nr:riboflavin synthase [Phycisphaerales bacterium]
MFTGLIQHLGRIEDLTPRRGGPEASSEAEAISLAVRAVGMDQPAVGDSVAVNGCCLTVASEPEVDGGAILVRFDVIPRTLELTMLGELEVGSAVNLEPALRVGDQLGGHIVQGHVDGVAIVDSVSRDGDDVRIWCRLPEPLRPLVVDRGSITVNGVSLTVTETDGERFCIALIPVTLEDTTLGSLAVGDRVNIECDMLARVVARMLESRMPG